MLSQSEKRGDDHNVRVRVRTRRSRAELMMQSETVNSEHVRGEMGKLDPGKATETSLNRTDGDGERLPQRSTAKKQWQPNAFTNFPGVVRNPRELAREPMTENKKNYISKSLIQRYGEVPGSPECLGASSRLTTTFRERFERPIFPNATDVTPVIPSAVVDPSPAGDAASTIQRHATQPTHRNTFTKLLE